MLQTRPVPVPIPVTGTETDQAAWQQCNSNRNLCFSPFKMTLCSLCHYFASQPFKIYSNIKVQFLFVHSPPLIELLKKHRASRRWDK